MPGEDSDCDWGLILATGLLVLLFALQAGSKLAGTQRQVTNFEAWGYPVWFMYTIGALELAGAIGLLFDRTAPLAASGLLIVLGGAFITHLLAGEYARLLLPVVAGLLLAYVGWTKRPDWLAPSEPA